MTAVTVEAITPVPPRHIEVGGHRIRLRLLQQIIWLFIAATAGAYVISALYYLITQYHWPFGSLKEGWDGLFKTAWWPQARHDIRDVFEGVMATLFGKSLMANWKHHPLRKVPDWRVATAPVVLFLGTLPFIAIGSYLLARYVPMINAPSWVNHIPQWLYTYLSTWNWQPVLLGVIIGQVAHRWYAPVGETVQLYFVSGAVARARKNGKVPVWVRYPVTPPVVRERFTWMLDNNIPAEKHSKASQWVVPQVAWIFLLLALYGGFIRLWFAKHGVPGQLF